MARNYPKTIKHYLKTLRCCVVHYHGACRIYHRDLETLRRGFKTLKVLIGQFVQAEREGRGQTMTRPLYPNKSRGRDMPKKCSFWEYNGSRKFPWVRHIPSRHERCWTRVRTRCEPN